MIIRYVLCVLRDEGNCEEYIYDYIEDKINDYIREHTVFNIAEGSLLYSLRVIDALQDFSPWVSERLRRFLERMFDALSLVAMYKLLVGGY